MVPQVFDLPVDLAPVSQVSRYYYGVVAANDVPARDWEAFVAYARANQQVCPPAGARRFASADPTLRQRARQRMPAFGHWLPSRWAVPGLIPRKS